ncbi:MAG: hypothetical protein PHX30_03475 [Candidatus Pacebacteria bacterium]|nr:hypothetical protein [Candidatus Paceibacterota bacterium]
MSLNGDKAKYLISIKLFQAHKKFAVLEKKITDLGPLFFITQAYLNYISPLPLLFSPTQKF